MLKEPDSELNDLIFSHSFVTSVHSTPPLYPRYLSHFGLVLHYAAAYMIKVSEKFSISHGFESVCGLRMKYQITLGILSTCRNGGVFRDDAYSLVECQVAYKNAKCIEANLKQFAKNIPFNFKYKIIKWIPMFINYA